jgi:site-specific DNA-methyltransferase (cytosine-N4-specific)
VDDLVLDPFAGSGTTLKVAKELKRNFVGYELSKEYEKVIKKKLDSVK